MSTPGTPPKVPRVPVDEGDIWRLSVDRYERMVVAGMITSDDRVELLEGILVPKMSKSPDHVLGTVLVNDAIRAILPSGWFVSSEQPVRMDDTNRRTAVIKGNELRGSPPSPEKYR